MSKETSFIKKDWLLILLVLAGLGLAVYFYPVLPDRVPSHWNFRGEIDGYSSRFFGAFGLPLINAALYILFLITPYFDPKKSNYRMFEGSYRLVRVVMHVFMFALQLIILASALGYAVNTGLLVRLGVAVIIVMIGNVMGRFKHNYFVGIKTPWTLASEEVWRKTHRMAAQVWVVGGLVCAVSAFWNSSASAVIFFAVMMILIIVPMAYSYIEYRKQ